MFQKIIDKINEEKEATLSINLAQKVSITYVEVITKLLKKKSKD